MARRSKPIRRSGLSGSLSTSDRRQRRSADIRERLFRAALDLFAQRGFAETTVEDITEAADVGKGTFFNYSRARTTSSWPSEKCNSATGSRYRDGSPHGRAHAGLPPFARCAHDAGAHTQPRHHPRASPGLSFNDSGSCGHDGPAKRVHALHSQMIQLGQDRGEIRNDLPAAEIANVFRQTISATLLIWSLYGDATLHSRIETAFNCCGPAWRLAGDSVPPLPARLFTSETSFMSRKRILILLAAAAVLGRHGALCRLVPPRHRSARVRYRRSPQHTCGFQDRWPH